MDFHLYLGRALCFAVGSKQCNDGPRGVTCRCRWCVLMPKWYFDYRETPSGGVESVFTIFAYVIFGTRFVMLTITIHTLPIPWPQSTQSLFPLYIPHLPSHSVHACIVSIVCIHQTHNSNWRTPPPSAPQIPIHPFPTSSTFPPTTPTSRRGARFHTT